MFNKRKKRERDIWAHVSRWEGIKWWVTACITLVVQIWRKFLFLKNQISFHFLSLLNSNSVGIPFVVFTSTNAIEIEVINLSFCIHSSIWIAIQHSVWGETKKLSWGISENIEIGNWGLFVRRIEVAMEEWAAAVAGATRAAEVVEWLPLC